MNPLSESDLMEINGGIIEVVIAGLIIAAGTNIIANWDSFKAGLAGEPDPAAINQAISNIK